MKRIGTGIRIESIEIRRCANNGKRVMDPVGAASIETINTEVHHTTTAGGSGVNGGIALEAISACDYTIKNCALYNNHDSSGAFGGIIILSERSVADGAIVKISDCILADEMQAIAHKHSGGVNDSAPQPYPQFGPGSRSAYWGCVSG